MNLFFASIAIIVVVNELSVAPWQGGTRGSKLPHLERTVCLFVLTNGFYFVRLIIPGRAFINFSSL